MLIPCAGRGADSFLLGGGPLVLPGSGGGLPVFFPFPGNGGGPPLFGGLPRFDGDVG